MGKNQDYQVQEPAPTKNEVETSELSDEELDETSGGIIIVGGKSQRAAIKIGSPFEKVALNPQPLPPKNFNIGPSH